MKSQYVYNASIFKSFCDENRLKILEMLQSGEKCGCKILEELQIAQSTLSHHMKILCDSGVVKSRKNGKWTHYSLDDNGCKYIIHLLEQITNQDVNNQQNQKKCC